MSNRILTGLIVAGILIILTCSNSNKPTANDESLAPPRPLNELTVQEKTAIQSINKFGWKLFRALYDQADPDENIFFSPLSVSYALGMALNGADGATFDSIKATLELHDLTIDEINLAFRELTRMLAAADSTVTFTTANSLWYRQNKQIRAAYIDNCTKYYFASVYGVDFGREATVKKINDWVFDNTNGKIPEIVSAPLDPSIATIIINAIYFKGNWSLEFDPDRTKTKQFYLAGGDSIECQLMYRNSQEDEQLFRDVYRLHPIGQFYDGDIVGATLPYGKFGFVMTLIVPDTVTTLNAIIPTINETRITNWGNIQSSPNCGYNIWLPRMKFSWSTSLVEPLKAIGMANAFSHSANFSRMFRDGIGNLTDARQKSFVQIDEKGTEAAVETELWHADCLEPFVRCDRPFLFFIQERTSGAILFIGKIGKPVWEN